MKTITDTRFLLREREEAYRAKGEVWLTSHALKDFRRNTLLFRKKELGLVEEEDRPAFLVGRAAHTLVLEGCDVFERTYAVGGPVNPKTGEVYGTRTKAYRAWAEAQGKPALTDDQFELVSTLAASVRMHKHAAGLFAEGVAEGVVRAQYLDTPCQARIDWFNPAMGLVDLKTCDCLDFLQMDARAYDYAHQLAFYRALVAEASGVVQEAWLVAVEKREPYRCGVWRMGTDVLGVAQKENEQAIKRLKKCRETDTWLSGYEEVRVFDYL